MDRLTDINNEDYCYKHCGAGCSEHAIPCMEKVIYKKLAMYEDTGLEPGEIANVLHGGIVLSQESVEREKKLAELEAEVAHLAHNNDNAERICRRYADGLNAYKALASIDDVQKWAKAERDGKLVVLPTDMFNTCYAVSPINCEYEDCTMLEDDGSCKPVENGTVPFECPHQVYEIKPYKLRFMDLHEIRLFATREEAEKALEEING